MQSAEYTDNSRQRYVATHTVYDRVGNKPEIVNGLTESESEGHSLRYTYDRFGNVLSVTDALGQQEHSEYDEVGVLQARTDRNGNRIEYVYDALDRVTC